MKSFVFSYIQGGLLPLGVDYITHVRRLSRRVLSRASLDNRFVVLQAPNRRYRILLVLLDATGARRTEAARIMVRDIDSQRMVIHSRHGKGAKDRDVPLSPELLEELRSWWRWKKPQGYLFPSTQGQLGTDQPISDKTVWHACRAAATRTGLTKKIHPHTLRHYAGSRNRRHTCSTLLRSVGAEFKVMPGADGPFVVAIHDRHLQSSRHASEARSASCGVVPGFSG